MVPGGRLGFERLEPAPRIAKRHLAASVAVADAKADIVLFQEVQPLPERAKVWQGILPRLSAYFQPDLCGIKIAGIGWPPSLQSGLVTLVNSKWSPRWVQSFKVSGPPAGIATAGFSLQWAETRYALFVEFLHQDWGRVLCANTHLHHGLELTDPLRSDLKQLQLKGALTEAALVDLKKRIAQADLRRLSEVRQILSRMQKIKGRYNLILLGGDFNFESQSQAYQEIVRFGFKDLWLSPENNDPGLTFDGARNLSNHEITRRVPLSINVEDLSFSPKSRQLVKDCLHRQEERGRRVDYLFAFSPDVKLTVNSTSLIGIPEQGEIAPSDHFGILAGIS
jgi:endonuclease/exonuclease/phosphatase family metal-dependent hydrolase